MYFQAVVAVLLAVAAHILLVPHLLLAPVTFPHPNPRAILRFASLSVSPFLCVCVRIERKQTRTKEMIIEFSLPRPRLEIETRIKNLLRKKLSRAREGSKALHPFEADPSETNH